MKQKDLYWILKKEFKANLENELRTKHLYRESCVQIILYNTLRTFLKNENKSVYPEIWYWKYKADIVILNEDIYKLMDDDYNFSKKNRVLNLQNIESNNVCNTLIEIKYVSYNKSALLRGMENDINAIINGINGLDIPNKIMILVYQTQKNTFNEELTKLEEEIKAVNGIKIFCYVYGGAKNHNEIKIIEK